MRPLAAIYLALAVAPLAAEPASITVRTGVLVEGMQCLSDPTQTYTLYLPSGYTHEKTWPVLLVFDPLGRSVSAAEVFREAAERWGWILLSSNDTRSDGPWKPNLKALNAMLPEIRGRYAADPRRIYAAGLSGGGQVAFLVGKGTGELAGAIVAGARLVPEMLREASFAVFACAGDRDFNYQEMIDTDALLGELGNPHRFESFVGLHTWMPAELAGEAVAWMELVAMRRDLRPLDETITAELYARDLAAAGDLEVAGDVLSALRRLEMMTRTYEGLTDTAAAEEAVIRLARSPEVKRARKGEGKWRAYEEHMRRSFAEAYTRLKREESTMSTPELRVALRLPALQKRAAEAGIEGATARRLLSTLFAETSYYVANPLLESRDWPTLVPLLSVATEVYDGWGAAWPAWYNLACAHAQTHNRRAALHALERAVAEGYSNFERMRNDPDLTPLHDTEAFQELVGTPDQ